jgi:hypothetical protein
MVPKGDETMDSNTDEAVKSSDVEYEPPAVLASFSIDELHRDAALAAVTPV